LYSSGFNRARDRGVWFQPRPGSSNESGFDQIFDRTLAAGWIVEKRSGIFPPGRSHLGYCADVSTELAKDFFNLRIGYVAQWITLKD